MDAVAARCGVSKKTPYRLFPAKTALFRAMVADHRRTMLGLPRPDAEPARRLLAGWLARQQERGFLRPFPPKAAARMLMDMRFSVLVKRSPGDAC